jgi:hypothetical protein
LPHDANSNYGTAINQWRGLGSPRPRIRMLQSDFDHSTCDLQSKLAPRLPQTPASAIAMLQPTFDSTSTADAAERFLRRLGPVGPEGEKSVGGGYNRFRTGVGGLAGRVCGHGWNRAYRRKIRRCNTLRRSGKRRYSDGNGFWTAQTLDFDESKLHLSPYTIGACVESAPLGPCIRPTALQQARNSLPIAHARAALMLDCPTVNARHDTAPRHDHPPSSLEATAKQRTSNSPTDWPMGEIDSGLVE